MFTHDVVLGLIPPTHRSVLWRKRCEDEDERWRWNNCVIIRIMVMKLQVMEWIFAAVFVKANSNFKIFFKVLEFLSKKPEPVQTPVTCVLPFNPRMAQWKPLITAFLLPDSNSALTLDLPFSFMWKAAVNGFLADSFPRRTDSFLSVFIKAGLLWPYTSLASTRACWQVISKHSTTDFFTGLHVSSEADWCRSKMQNCDSWFEDSCGRNGGTSASY